MSNIIILEFYQVSINSEGIIFSYCEVKMKTRMPIQMESIKNNNFEKTQLYPVVTEVIIVYVQSWLSLGGFLPHLNE